MNKNGQTKFDPVLRTKKNAKVIKVQPMSSFIAPRYRDQSTPFRSLFHKAACCWGSLDARSNAAGTGLRARSKISSGFFLVLDKYILGSLIYCTHVVTRLRSASSSE